MLQKEAMSCIENVQAGGNSSDLGDDYISWCTRRALSLKPAPGRSVLREVSGYLGDCPTGSWNCANRMFSKSWEHEQQSWVVMKGSWSCQSLWIGFEWCSWCHECWRVALKSNGEEMHGRIVCGVLLEEFMIVTEGLITHISVTLPVRRLLKLPWRLPPGRLLLWEILRRSYCR